ncbi:hypothetical protein CDAR_87761 [Caerostris darwini]|uniref:Uncharacterized protein n=1 Tax=Caerostris darwini TaxID=1538125 RepID=A0AAV4S521_9ARAC|nr:hypothetical protein CDAR_87761 [Caerostris darwini]
MLSHQIRRVYSKPIGHKSRAVKKSPIFLPAEETTQTKDDTNLRHTAAAKQARKIIVAKNKRKVKRISEMHNRCRTNKKGFFRPLGSGCENTGSRTEVKCYPMHYWMTRLTAVSCHKEGWPRVAAR